MSSSPQCPDRATLEQLANGQLTGDAGHEVEQHMLECGDCFETLHQLQQTDALLETLRHLRTLSTAAPRGTMKDKILGEMRRLSESGAFPALPPELQSTSQLSVTPVSGVASGVAAITYACGKCGRKLRVKPELTGRRVKCPGCGDVTMAPAAVSAPAEHREVVQCLSPPQGPGEIGRLGVYRVLQILGQGGMGVVFRAEDLNLKRPVALKAMLPGLGASESARKRFILEGQAAAAVKHDHIVSIYQVGEERGIPYLAMEFLEGESLDDRLKREQRTPFRDVLRIGRQIAEGLAAAHEQKLIHRDIKPANIWLEGKRGRVKILDFGLARVADQDQFLTQSGVIVGTPAFMSPEQSRGETLDGRADLFSFGVVLYRMATGEQPFRGKDSVSTLMAIAMESPADPRTLVADIPADLSSLIVKLLEKDPANRPATAEEVAETLGAMEESRNGEVSVSGMHAALPPPVRSRWPLVVGSLIGIVLIVTGVVLVFLNRG